MAGGCQGPGTAPHADHTPNAPHLSVAYAHVVLRNAPAQAAGHGQTRSAVPQHCVLFSAAVSALYRVRTCTEYLGTHAHRCCRDILEHRRISAVTRHGGRDSVCGGGWPRPQHSAIKAQGAAAVARGQILQPSRQLASALYSLYGQRQRNACTALPLSHCLARWFLTQVGLLGRWAAKNLDVVAEGGGMRS